MYHLHFLLAVIRYESFLIKKLINYEHDYVHNLCEALAIFCVNNTPKIYPMLLKLSGEAQGIILYVPYLMTHRSNFIYCRKFHGTPFKFYLLQKISWHNVQILFITENFMAQSSNFIYCRRFHGTTFKFYLSQKVFWKKRLNNIC